MLYKRMPIEIEAPEGFGYENIDCNLSESSFTDQRLGDLGININDLVLLYGDHKGKPELRELLTSEIGLSVEDVLITSGAAMALFIVATSLLNKGDHLVVAKSNYATNLETPRAIGADISFLELKFENNFDLDVEELKQKITPQIKLVSLTYPHNPTGVMIDEDKLRTIIGIIEDKNTYLLLDETYRDMCFVKKLPVAATLSDRVISISSMSKSYGLPGIRIGWMFSKNKQLMETFLAAKEQICITNSVIDQEIAFHYLKRKEELFAPNMQTIKNNFAILKQFMEQQNVLEWVEPKGGCVCFPRIKKEINVDADKFHDILLNKYKTYIGRGHWFEEDARYMRIGYSWDKTEKLEKGLQNILRAIDEARIP
ncbi:pyridoxal phosphate-dependent aminotransferase [Pinibacter aurantiacus]|uniref:Pyridoxal phosphate-dependent aminotransferase n=1 Tax=Pinibacter aurantiacus TaxID=2851599 RepID=A0A9E2S9K9_9BACT|nr:pyridoxal phosphate-dependent aminotransferase [Pinibacter aurantiacus]MBV4358941.1 pyridoxal phosphate-dependent aminotransferase [Pinibacter aurantiacus]